MAEKKTVKKKTPTARVLAAKWLLGQLDTDSNYDSLSPGAIGQLGETRVNEKKAEQVKAQLAKMAGKFVDRMKAIVDKFEGK